ncbi:C-type natriuretic peptide 2-like [Cynoglossus semilaevis]|uniref:C-type natriuretic peptide 2-like n=1 Tax=Cynoglossus semilaevis TaxID=244447 RepID=A0A3P8V3S7_CYNSE|nr:C-type natriuretic peptide 2-like [Cynoglossus semilaevis]XP_024914150.1 C-type natriuretic peptide 2-like [Cynoglossus semilaevis]
MAFSPSSSFFPILLLLLAITVESRPSPQKDNKQVLDSLFGSHLSSLLSASSTFNDDVTEGSADNTSPSSSANVAQRLNQEQGLADRQGAVPRFFLDFLRRQTKMRRRSRKSMVGGRGCFGMKMDRIGSVSGLGC